MQRTHTDPIDAAIDAFSRSHHRQPQPSQAGMSRENLQRRPSGNRIDPNSTLPQSVPITTESNRPPEPLWSTSCVARFEQFRKQFPAESIMTGNLPLILFACSTKHPFLEAYDLVFLIVNQIMCLGRTEPKLLPNDIWKYFDDFQRTHGALCNMLIPHLVPQGLLEPYMQFFSTFPAPFNVTSLWGSYKSLMTEGLNFIYYLETRLSAFIRYLQEQKRPPTPHEVLRQFGTASECLHFILFCHCSEICLATPISTPNGRRMWDQYLNAYYGMRNSMTTMHPPRQMHGPPAQPPQLAPSNRNTRLTKHPLPLVQHGQATQNIQRRSSQASNSNSIQSPAHPNGSSLGAAPSPLVASNSSTTISPLASTSPVANGSGILGTPNQGRPIPPTQQQALAPIISNRRLANSFFPPPGKLAPTMVPPEPSRHALHQAHLRSPRLRATRHGPQAPDGEEPERLYRYVSGFVMEVEEFASQDQIVEWQFDVDADHLMRRPVLLGDERQVPFDSVFYRLRCTIADPPSTQLDAGWETKNTYWPAQVFFQLNDKRLEERRKAGHGKDLPIDVSPYLQTGQNRLRVICFTDKAKLLQQKFAVAIEMIEVGAHKSIVEKCTKRLFSQEATLEAIAGQLDSKDDEVQITSTNIGLFDPMLASKMWDVPVRGPHCRHREAWDLETFLNSRSTRPGDEVTLVDVWSCPICGKDVRPNVILMDEWLCNVRKELASRDKLDTRAIRVEANGSWKIVEEASSKHSGNREADKGTTEEAASRPPRDGTKPSVFQIDSD